MNIDEIETFVAIAELGGFTSAGQRLHRTQPAISRRLGILEHELGAPMFERIRGNARLTEAGRTFLPHAEAALAALKDGREAVRGLKGGMQGAISLALVGTLADTQHRRRAAPVRAAREERAARTAHRVEHRGDRPRAARRDDAGPALFHHRSRRTRRAGCRQRVDAGGRGTRPQARRAPRARCPPVAGRALDRLPAVTRRAGFLRPCPDASTDPCRTARGRCHPDRQPDRAETSGSGRLRPGAGAGKQRARRTAPWLAGGARCAGDADGHPDRRNPPPQRLSQPRRHDTAGAVDAGGSA